jgi:hypothetical protein
MVGAVPPRTVQLLPRDTIQLVIHGTAGGSPTFDLLVWQLYLEPHDHAEST